MPKDKGYLLLTLGFTAKTSEEQAIKEIKNYIRRIRAYRQTRGMKQSLQYIFGVNVDATQNLGTIIMSKIDPADAAALWKNGMSLVQTINTNEIKPGHMAEDMRANCPGGEWTSSKDLKARYLKHVLKYLNVMGHETNMKEVALCQD